MRARNQVSRVDVIWRCCFIVLKKEEKKAKHCLLCNSSSALIVAFDVNTSFAMSYDKFKA